MGSPGQHGYVTFGTTCPFDYIDVCSASKPSQIDLLKSHLNSIYHSIQFTSERETDGSIAFLDAQLTREQSGDLTTTVYCLETA